MIVRLRVSPVPGSERRWARKRSSSSRVSSSGRSGTASACSSQRQRRRSDEVVCATDSGDFVAADRRQRAQRLASARSHGGSRSEK